MREKKKNRIEILGIAMLVLLISGVCMIPCFKTGLPYGDDQQVHMLRVESILKALKSGQRGFTDDVADCLNGSGQIMWHVLILLQNGCFQILPQKRLL